MVDLAQIHPVTDFVRHYKSFFLRIKKTGKPEILTVNGRPEYVILDAGTYQSIADELEHNRFLRAVQDGIDDMKAGRGKPAAVAFRQIRDDLDL